MTLVHMPFIRSGTLCNASSSWQTLQHGQRYLESKSFAAYWQAGRLWAIGVTSFWKHFIDACRLFAPGPAVGLGVPAIRPAGDDFGPASCLMKFVILKLKVNELERSIVLACARQPALVSLVRPLWLTRHPWAHERFLVWGEGKNISTSSDFKSCS